MTEMSRRDWLQATTAFGIALSLMPTRPFAQDLKPLKFAVGLKAMGPAVINTVIGEVLGYNAQEGFTIKPLALGTNANVQIAIDKGDVDVGIGVPSFGLPLLAKGEWQGALNYYQYTYPYKWDVAVNPNSPIKSYGDLKGKKVGVSDFGGTETPVTKRVLASLGINPETEVTWIPVGNGVQAGTALQRGAIDALAYYDTGFGQIEGANVPLVFLPRPPNLPMIGGQFLTAKKPFLAGSRSLAVGLGRAAAEAGYRIRPRGAMHGWSPLTIVPGSDLSSTVLLDTTAMVGIEVDAAASPPRITAGCGVMLDDLWEALGDHGLSLASTPATGTMTVGGALAIDAHGAVVGTPGEDLPAGLGFGSVSNQILSLDAIVWSDDESRYVLRTFERSDPAIGPLLVHLGRSLITRATLQVGAAVRVRCQSYTDVTAAELFRSPAEATSTDRTFISILDRCGRAEAIWFPFTDTPWVKEWSVADTQPAGSKRVNGPYNYEFTDHFPPEIAKAFVAILDGNPTTAVDFGKLQLAIVNLAMPASNLWDLWGWDRDLTRYIRATTFRQTEGGGAILCRRSDVQELVHGFATWHEQRLESDRAAGRFPINGPLEIRCSGLDHAGVVAGAAGPPLLSALRPRDDHPEWDTALWIESLTSPGMPGAAAYYVDMENWLREAAAKGFGVLRAEWSKAWAWAAKGAWTSPTRLAQEIPDSFGPPGDRSAWDDAVAALAAHDPQRVFTNPFLDQLMP